MRPEGFTGDELGRESGGIEAQGDTGMYGQEDQGNPQGGHLREKVQEVTQGLKQKAVDKAHDARQQLRSRGAGLINQQKQRLTGELGLFSGLFRDTAERLREENRTSVAHYADLAGDKIDQACDYIEQRDVSQMLRDVESFARRRSEIVLGAMFLAGLVAARFIKASSRGGKHGPDEGNDYGGDYGGEGVDTEYGRHNAKAGEYPEAENQPSGSYEGASLREQTFTDAGIDEDFPDPSAAANPELDEDVRSEGAEASDTDLSPLSTGFKQRRPPAGERPDALGNSPSTTPPPSGGSGI